MRKVDGIVGENLIELFENLLFERAVNGNRPVLYVSSYKDLECSVMNLLEDFDDDEYSIWPATERRGLQPLAN